MKLEGYTSPAYAPSSAHDSQTPNIQHGYLNGTGGDLIRLTKLFCNGKVIVPDQSNSLVIERRDYFPPSTPYQLPDIRMDWNGYNTEELAANIIIKFQSDLNEKNCIDFIDKNGNPFYPGTIAQITHQQNITVDPLKICLKGLREINLPVARGAAKDRLNFIEKAVGDIEIVWKAIVDAFIAILDGIIAVLNAAIVLINVLISIINAVITAVIDVINVVISIVDAISSLFGGSGPHKLDVGKFQIPSIPPIPYISFIPLTNDLGNRINALLLENDMVNTPKLLLIDTSRSEFINRRIAYLKEDGSAQTNTKVINADWLRKYFYCIDFFADNPDYAHLQNPVNNRFTKISPSLNKYTEKNLFTMSLKDFKNSVNNPKMLDNFGEEIIAESVQWFPEKNGAAEIRFRKKGWLRDFSNFNGAKRAKEIAINLNLNISLPNGQ